MQAFEGLVIGGFKDNGIGSRTFVDLLDMTAGAFVSFSRAPVNLGTSECTSEDWSTPDTLSLTFNVRVEPADANNTKLITADGTNMTVVVNKVL